MKTRRPRPDRRSKPFVPAAACVADRYATPPPSVETAPHHSGDGLRTCLGADIGGTFTSAVVNAGTVRGGAGGALVDAPGATANTTVTFPDTGGAGIKQVGPGSILDDTTGIIAGGVGGAGFAGSPSQQVTPGVLPAPLPA